MSTGTGQAVGGFTYHRGSDGVDATWDICYPDGTYLVSIHFWDLADETEAEAKMIVKALNAYKTAVPIHVFEAAISHAKAFDEEVAASHDA